MRWARVAAVTAVLLACPAAAQADSWLASAPFGAPTAMAFAPSLAFNSRGGALAAWTSMPSLTTVAQNAVVAARGRDGVFTAPKVVDQLAIGGVALDDAGGTLLVGTRSPASGATVNALTGTLSRGFVHSQRLALGASGSVPVPPVLASDSRGDAVVAWIQGPNRHTTSHDARLAIGRTGGRFARSRVVARGFVDDVAVAMNARGQFVVASLRGRRVEARLGHGYKLGPIVRLGRLRPLMYAEETVTAAIDSKGDVLVAWRANLPGTTGYTNGVSVAYKPAGGAFGPSRRVAAWRGDVLETHGIRAVFAAPGKAMLAWDGANSSGEGVMASAVDRGKPSRPVMLSPPSGIAHFENPLDAVAAIPGGGAAVAWSQLGPVPPNAQRPGQLMVSIAADGAHFDPPEQVSPPDADAQVATLAFDPAASSLVALWQSGGFRLDPPFIETMVLSTRQ